MSETDLTALTRALAGRVPENDVQNLAVLISVALKEETTLYYRDVPLEDPVRSDTLLTAFEERLLIPVRSRQSPAWDDRIIDFGEGGMFFMPRVIRTLFEAACQSGELNSETAIRRVLENEKAGHVDDTVRFLKELRPHADSCMAEGGLMAAVARGAGLSAPVHDIVDACVIVGIMSPCTRGSSVQGLIWYEINPCLYWDERFA